MVKSEVKERFIRKSVASLIITITARLGGFIFALILARTLAPEGYGLYSLALSLALIFFTFTDLGINATITRYVSYSIKRKINPRPYYTYLLKIKSYLTIAFTLLLIIIAYPISKYIYQLDSLFLPLIAAAFYVAISSFESFYTMIFYSLEDVRFISKKEFTVQLSKIIFAIIILIFASPDLKVFLIIMSLFFIYVIFLIIDLAVLRKIIPSIFTKSKNKVNKKEVNNYLKYISIATISTVLFSNIDSVLLGLFVSAEYLGYYRAALNLIMGLIGILSFPNLILIPFFSKSSKGDTKAVINKMFYYTSLIALPTTLGIIALSNFIMKAFYGDSYLLGSSVLSILSLSILPWTFVIFIISFLTAENETKAFAKLVLKSTLLNFLLIMIFSLIYRNISSTLVINSAAFALVISWIYYFMGSMNSLNKKFKIKINLKRAIIPLISSIIMFIFIKVLTNSITDMTALIGILVIILSSIVYAVLLLIFKAFPKEDILQIKNSFFKK